MFDLSGLNITEDEGRELIRYHRDAAAKLKSKAKVHEEKAKEIEAMLMPKTLAYVGRRAD